MLGGIRWHVEDDNCLCGAEKENQLWNNNMGQTIEITLISRQDRTVKWF
jgi:hypothetical protein